MGKIDLSVIIPTYNRAHYLGETIKSVLNQKNVGIAYEVIVVDDGSTDTTEAAIASFGDIIHYKKIPNSGRPAVPRNIGIEMARGDLIAFQDSDDLWVPDKLVNQLALMEDGNTALSYGNAAVMKADGTLTGATILDHGQGKTGHVFKDLLEVNFISTLTVITRRQLLLDAGGFNESLALRGVEDYELWLRLSRLGNFSYLDKPLAHYRQHDDNISLKEDPVGSLSQLKNVYSSLNKMDLSQSEKKLVKTRCRHLMAELSSVAPTTLQKLRYKILSNL